MLNHVVIHVAAGLCSFLLLNAAVAIHVRLGFKLRRTAQILFKARSDQGQHPSTHILSGRFVLPSHDSTRCAVLVDL